MHEELYARLYSKVLSSPRPRVAQAVERAIAEHRGAGDALKELLGDLGARRTALIGAQQIGGVQGAHLNPLGLFLDPLDLFLRTSIPFIWRVLSAFLRS